MNNLPEPKYSFIVDKLNKVNKTDIVQTVFIGGVEFKLVSNEKYVKVIKVKRKPVTETSFNEFKHLVEYFYDDVKVTYAVSDK